MAGMVARSGPTSCYTSGAMTTSRNRRARARVAVRAFEDGDAVAVGRLLGPHETLADLRRRWSGADPSARALVVVVGEDVMGFGTLRMCSGTRTRFVADVAVALHDKVPEDAARSLLDELVELAERWLGALRLQTSVPVDDKRAISLLTDRGFGIEGVARSAALRNGELIDTFHAARVANKVPWPRVTAEDVAQRPPPQLTSGASEDDEDGADDGNGGPPRGGFGWGFGLN